MEPLPAFSASKPGFGSGTPSGVKRGGEGWGVARKRGTGVLQKSGKERASVSKLLSLLCARPGLFARTKSIPQENKGIFDVDISSESSLMFRNRLWNPWVPRSLLHGEKGIHLPG